MLILYVKDYCPFSTRAMNAAKELEIALDIRNIKEKQFEHELLQKGGKLETPYLVDEANNVAMYESSDIISYLINQTIS